VRDTDMLVEYGQSTAWAMGCAHLGPGRHHDPCTPQCSAKTKGTMLHAP